MAAIYWVEMKTLLIIPWFGKLPAIFPYWAASCGANAADGYDWLLVTDQKEDIERQLLPKNINTLVLSFADFQKKVQKCFDFTIFLNRPHKICDFKPALGVIFREYLTGYDYWGYCDMDLVFGRLAFFLAAPMQNGYEKLLELGHLCLMRTTERMLIIFKEQRKGCLFYKDVYTTDRELTFDEDAWPRDAPLKGFMTLCDKVGITTWKSPYCYSDVSINTYEIPPLNTERDGTCHNVLYAIYDGKVICASLDDKGVVVENEKLYVHAQKRRISCEAQDCSRFLMVPPGRIVTWQDNWRQNISKFTSGGVSQWKFYAVRYLRKHYGYFWHKIKRMFGWL